MSERQGGVKDFQFLVIHSLAARRMWVNMCLRCGGRLSMPRFNRARSGDGEIEM